MFKIVHIARPIAGVGVYVDLLINHIDDTRFKNFLISNHRDKNFEVITGSLKNTSQFHVNLKREINIIKDIKCLLDIIKLIREINPDIIHCHSAKAGFLGRIAGAYLKIPTVYTPHAFSYLSGENKLKRNLFKNLEKIFRVFPSKIIACSKSEYNRAIYDLQFNEDKLFIWNNSIEDITEFSPSKVIENLPEKFICSIGRPSYQKNIEMLLETMSQIKKSTEDIHLVLLGIGSPSHRLDKLKKFIKKNDLSSNITLIPWLERAEVMSILKACYVYVSSSRYEGLPYSIIEALSLEKPCVVTNVDGNKDLIVNKYNGYTVEVEDTQHMAEKIILMYNESNIVMEMSKNSRKEYLNKYNIENNIHRLEKFYTSEIG